MVSDITVSRPFKKPGVHSEAIELTCETAKSCVLSYDNGLKQTAVLRFTSGLLDSCTGVANMYADKQC